MKKLLFSLLTLCLFSCEKSLEGNDLAPQNMKLTDIGVSLNTPYRVQQMSGGQWVDMTDQATITFVSDQQVKEQRGTKAAVANAYTVTGQGTSGANSLRIKFFALPACDPGNCPLVISASDNSEIYKQNGELFLARHDDAGNPVYKLK